MLSEISKKQPPAERRNSLRVRAQPVTVAGSESRRRSQLQRLDALENDNYDPTKPKGRGDAKDDDDDDAESSRKKRLRFAKAVVQKSLRQIIQDEGEPSYTAAAVPPSAQPPRAFCSVCGYWGTYTCIACGWRFCSQRCQKAHNDTRCLKLVR
eukprot:gnl/Spiro4/9661_TR5127_c0_g1_i1.p2 gnl/Spiro4/9661_TR5127_c0_g1~~gnl/Spiro4/9661_TR5127_c0_g1_i1.p2  ORF type:complete len:153 (-),score=43.91 gnl/Spiro4/9661_TR5127_c0_g1_i1:133-591(-)